MGSVSISTDAYVGWGLVGASTGTGATGDICGNDAVDDIAEAPSLRGKRDALMLSSLPESEKSASETVMMEW